MKYFTTSDGVAISYTEKGAGIPVILVPGYSMSGQAWFLQSSALAEAGYRAIEYSNRFHGCSGRPAHGKRLSRLAADLHEFIVGLGLQRPVLVGLSMGASTIYAYLSLFGDELLRGCAFIDQTPKLINDDTWSFGQYNLMMETVIHALNSPPPVPQEEEGAPQPPHRAELERILAGQPPFDPEAAKPLILDHTFADWRDVFPLVKVPALFFAGQSSPLWPCGHAQYAASRCQNGRALVMEGCGHGLNFEKPEEFNRELLAFLKELG